MNSSSEITQDKRMSDDESEVNKVQSQFPYSRKQLNSHDYSNEICSECFLNQAESIRYANGFKKICKKCKQILKESKIINPHFINIDFRTSIVLMQGSAEFVEKKFTYSKIKNYLKKNYSEIAIAKKEIQNHEKFLSKALNLEIKKIYKSVEDFQKKSLTELEEIIENVSADVLSPKINLETLSGRVIQHIMNGDTLEPLSVIIKDTFLGIEDDLKSILSLKLKNIDSIFEEPVFYILLPGEKTLNSISLINYKQSTKLLQIENEWQNLSCWIVLNSKKIFYNGGNRGNGTTIIFDPQTEEIITCKKSEPFKNHTLCQIEEFVYSFSHHSSHSQKFNLNTYDWELFSGIPYKASVLSCIKIKKDVILAAYSIGEIFKYSYLFDSYMIISKPFGGSGSKLLLKGQSKNFCIWNDKIFVSDSSCMCWNQVGTVRKNDWWSYTHGVAYGKFIYFISTNLYLYRLNEETYEITKI